MKKSKQPLKEQIIKVKAKKPRQIKAALRAWMMAASKADSNLFGLDDAPQWVENAWAEVVKITVPGRSLPTSGGWDAELIGELMGRQQSLSKLFEGEIPMGPDTTSELERLLKFVASQPQTPKIKAKQALAVQDLATMTKANTQAIPQVMEAMLGSSHDDALKFNKGFSRGMALAPDDLTTAKTFQRHTRTYYVLALQWRTWTKCNSLREVHGYLCKGVGEQKIGNFRTFEKLCEKIGFKLRGRGRPPGPK